MKKLNYLAAAAIAATSFALSGCEDTDMTRNDQESTEIRRETRRTDADTRTAGERMEDTAQTAAEKTEAAAEKTGEAIESGADRAADAVRDTADRDATAAPDGTEAPDSTAAAPDAEGIRDTLASATDATLTKDGFDDLVERFVDADRNRIGDYADDQGTTELNGLVAALQEQWKAKYNQEFDIQNEELVFNDSYQIQQSEQTGEARLAGEGRGVDVDVNREADGTGVDVDVQNKTGVDAPGSDAADRNLNDPGRNIATVTVPESHGLPQLTLNLIHELPDAWRIDIPDGLDGAKLHKNLKDHLTAVKDASATWPDDVNDAYRLVSHHIFMALQDQPVSGAAATPGM